MHQRSTRTALGLILIILALGALFTASSLAAQQSTARVLGGAGTVADPLRIEVTGDVGLAGLIDSLLPFDALPSVDMFYRDLAFAIPGLNPLFVGRPWLNLAFLVGSTLTLFWALLWTVLAISGKKLVIRDRR